jgi:hypothetical protein
MHIVEEKLFICHHEPSKVTYESDVVSCFQRFCSLLIAIVMIVIYLDLDIARDDAPLWALIG